MTWASRLVAAPWLSRSAPLGRLARSGLRLIPRGLALPILSGPLRGARWVIGVGEYGYWLGTYESLHAQVFAAHLKPGMTVLDLGAHAGWYTLLAARRVGPNGRVVAVEPEPENVANLHRHLSLNPWARATVVAAAVTDREGEVFLAGGSRSTSSAAWHVAPTGPLRVRGIALDPLIARGELPVPDVIKMDVEGAEGSVLAGASNLLAARRATWFVGTHGPEMNEACWTQFVSAGYHLTVIKPFQEWWGEFLATPV